MDLKALQENYFIFLDKEGYKPVLDGNENIVFQFNGINYVLQFNNGNKPIVTINLGHPYDFKSNEEKIRALQIVNFVNRSLRIGKMWVDTEEGSVNVLVGLFLVKEGD
jgi:hypothetical protein